MAGALHLHHDGLSRPLAEPRLRVLSLGAGVQSTTLALMAARGDIEAPDCAIFADTGWEPSAVYRHLDWLETQLPFPIHRVRRIGADLGETMLELASGARAEEGTSLIPYFVGSGGMIPKQCSKEFKTRPVARKIVDLVGAGPQVELWLGISRDELQRLKTNERRWITNRFPLIEARMTRRDCEVWMAERQYSAPRSACIFCPFRSRADWLSVQDSAEDWGRVVDFDGRFRSAHPDGAFLLKTRQSLADADFSAPDNDAGFDFSNECEGMCGV